jgi:hypothetical protein
MAYISSLNNVLYATESMNITCTSTMTLSVALVHDRPAAAAADTTHRTSNKAGAWYSIGKAVYDYSAQFSPNPSYAALAAAGAPAGPLKPGQPCI